MLSRRVVIHHGAAPTPRLPDVVYLSASVLAAQHVDPDARARTMRPDIVIHYYAPTTPTAPMVAPEDH